MTSSGRTSERGSPLTVVLLCFGLRGGMVHYCAHLANALADRTDVEVFVVTPETAETKEAFEEGVTLRTFDISFESLVATLVSGPTAVATIVSHVRSIDPDVVHDTSYGGYPSMIVDPILSLLGNDLVGTIHDPIPHSGHEVELFGVDIRFAALRGCSRFLTTIVVHGEASKRDARNGGYPSERLAVLPHGIYDQFTGDHDLERETDYEMLFFGNIRPNKGYDRVPDIVDQVAEELGSVSALVAGTTDIHSAIPDEEMDRIVSGLREHPQITLRDEYIPEEEVPELFERSAILVLPYYDATQSGVALMGYAFEKPMVATDTGDMGAMIERDGTGLLADPDDSGAIADQIVRLLRDDWERERLALRVSEQRSKHSWETIADLTVEHYHLVG